ncbi:MAG: glycosyltransferase, partial [Nostoc sp.]
FLAEPNNPTDFAHKVIAILENPNLKADLTRQARPSILDFDWSACMQKLEDKLYQIVEGSQQVKVGTGSIKPQR